jgi:hypothetical protein
VDDVWKLDLVIVMIHNVSVNVYDYLNDYLYLYLYNFRKLKTQPLQIISEGCVYVFLTFLLIKLIYLRFIYLFDIDSGNKLVSTY